jgi:hypothetical protein
MYNPIYRACASVRNESVRNDFFFHSFDSKFRAKSLHPIDDNAIINQRISSDLGNSQLARDRPRSSNFSNAKPISYLQFRANKFIRAVTRFYPHYRWTNICTPSHRRSDSHRKHVANRPARNTYATKSRTRYSRGQNVRARNPRDKPISIQRQTEAAQIRFNRRIKRRVNQTTTSELSAAAARFGAIRPL